MNTYTVGDIHGCYHTLLDLINRLPLEHDDQLIFLGDYIDRGPFSKEVVEYIKELTDYGQAIALMGNHERMCFDTYDHYLWLQNGGTETLDSYDTRAEDEKVMPAFDSEDREVWLKNQPKVSKEHLKWMEKLPLFYEDDDYFYVHAGVDPSYELNQQSEGSLLWIRNVFLNSDKDFGKKIIFGHTPLNEVLIRPNKIGIDTGCVFGLKLTAFCPQTNTFFSAPQHERDYNEYTKIAG